MGNIASVVGGGTPPTGSPEYFGGDIPWLTPADLSGYRAKHISSGARSITPAGYAHSGTQMMPAGAILFSSRAPVGYVAIASNPLCTNQGFKSFVLDEGLVPDFAYYYLQYAKPLALHLSSGTTFREISGKNAALIPVPLVPTREQRRIADALDELLSDLDEGVAALQRARAKLKLYRAAVLKAAVEGALTAGWRAQHPDSEPASELLQRILIERRQRWEAAQLAKYEAAGKPPPKNWKAKYKQPVAPDTTDLRSLPEGWCWASVDQLIRSPICNGISVRGSDAPPGVAALRLNAMGDFGFDYSKRRYLPLAPASVDDLWILGGDFFVSRGNGSKELVGRGTLAQEPGEEIIFPDTMMRLRLEPTLQRTNWVPVLWRSAMVRVQIERTAKTTAGIWKISQPDLARLVIPLPSEAEQLVVVEAADEQLSTIDRLDADLAAKLQSAQGLRQAILRDAFAGKLVPQDPHDEPASELLQRIAAAREQRARELKAAKKAGKATKRGTRQSLAARRSAHEL